MAESLWRRVLFPSHRPRGPDVPRVQQYRKAQQALQMLGSMPGQ